MKDSEEVKSKAEMRFIHLTLLCIDTDNLSQIILSQRNALKQISQKRELKKRIKGKGENKISREYRKWGVGRSNRKKKRRKKGREGRR